MPEHDRGGSPATPASPQPPAWMSAVRVCDSCGTAVIDRRRHACPRCGTELPLVAAQEGTRAGAPSPIDELLEQVHQDVSELQEDAADLPPMPRTPAAWRPHGHTPGPPVARITNTPSPSPAEGWEPQSPTDPDATWPVPDDDAAADSPGAGGWGVPGGGRDADQAVEVGDRTQDEDVRFADDEDAMLAEHLAATEEVEEPAQPPGLGAPGEFAASTASPVWPWLLVAGAAIAALAAALLLALR